VILFCVHLLPKNSVVPRTDAQGPSRGVISPSGKSRVCHRFIADICTEIDQIATEIEIDHLQIILFVSLNGI
jgi:hypothetical protein